ncbi:MAG: hypothetical protein JW709_13270 [Sedimentisphaerales bacterium]|nr:hypothetical protein [Sedimentisphaerales bacterium]
MNGEHEDCAVNKREAAAGWVGKFTQLSEILAYDLRVFSWPVLSIPALFTVVWAWLYAQGILTAPKEKLEIVGLSVIHVALAIALVRLMLARHVYFIWLVGLSGACVCREYHFAGTSTGIYVVLAVLLWSAWWFYGAMATYFRTRLVVNLLAAVFLCYIISQMLDQQWWRFLIGVPAWSSPVEESLEVLGHAGQVLLVSLSRQQRLQTTIL